MRVCFFFLLLLTSVASACQVPVFRYALERWPADRYELAVFYSEAVNVEIPSAANLDVVKIDIAKMDDADRAIYGDVKLNDGAALMRLFYPREVGIDEPIWEAPFTPENLAKVIDSPARKAIRERILAGKSAVWVIVDGDAVLEGKLTAQLKTISESLEISDAVIGPGNLDRVASGEVAMEDVLRSTIPLKIDFDLMRIQRDDPAEEVFIRMLFGVSQDALEQYPDAPLLFPVFGRGRSIDGVPAPIASEELLRNACDYLCGACSCEVKKENPGIDLIMNIDWDAFVAGSEVVIEKELPPLSGAGDLVEPTKIEEEEPPVGPKDPGIMVEALIMAGSFILVIVFATIAFKGKFKDK